MAPATKREMTDGLRERLLHDEQVLGMISRRAYEIYQDRGEEPGHDREDWLRAESEVLDELIEKELRGRLELDLPAFPAPQVHQGIPNYELFTTPPASVGPAESWPAKSAPSGQPVPGVVRTSVVSAVSGKPPRNKLERASKSDPSRKGKKSAGPADGEARRTADATGKSSSHKSKKGKKKEKRAEDQAEKRHPGKTKP
jgi:hypothetical protein